MVLHKELIEQSFMDILLKIRFEHEDGSLEELIGTVEEKELF